MGEINKLIVENQEQRELIRHLQSCNQILDREMKKYRSQSIMRANKIELLEKQLEQAYE